MSSPNKCKGLTSKGIKCSRNCSNSKATQGNSEFCWQHDKKEIKIESKESKSNICSGSQLPYDISLYHQKSDNINLIKEDLSKIHPYFSYDKEAFEFVNDLTYDFYLKFIYTKNIEEILNILDIVLKGELSKYAKLHVHRSFQLGFSIERLQVVPTEYIIAEINELAGNITRNSLKKRIDMFFVNKAISDDDELYELFKGKVLKKEFFDIA
jgi:hypothetical protein